MKTSHFEMAEKTTLGEEVKVNNDKAVVAGVEESTKESSLAKTTDSKKSVEEKGCY